MPLRVGLNGAGRIGRALLRLLYADPAVEVVAINDTAGLPSIVHLLGHDSLYGVPPFSVGAAGEELLLEGRPIPFSSSPHPEQIPWTRHGVEVVVEATGWFATADQARRHLSGSVRSVLVTAVCPGAEVTLLGGVHDAAAAARRAVVSTASCTTQAAGLPLALLDRWYGVVAAEMTTVHCTTGSQVTMDQPHRDLRRARSAMLSIIPTTTSAGAGLDAVLPALAGRIACLAIRVPTTSVSLVEIVAATGEATDPRERLVARLGEAASGELAGRLGVSDEPLVSIDFKGDTRSAIVDLPLLELPGERLVRLVAWYDNEWGYSNRVAEVLRVWGELPR